MKANKAPEKIYMTPSYGEPDNVLLASFSKSHLNFHRDIEYIRADAFVEKACEYISEHVEYYMKKDKACNVPLCPLFATKSFIEDFRKYMEE